MMVGSPLSLFNTLTLAAAPAKGWPLIQRWVSLTSQLPAAEAERECFDLRLRLGELLEGRVEAKTLLTVLADHDPERRFRRFQGLNGTEDVWQINGYMDEECLALLADHITSLERYLEGPDDVASPGRSRPVESAQWVFDNAEEVEWDMSSIFHGTLRLIKGVLDDRFVIKTQSYQKWRAEIEAGYNHIKRRLDDLGGATVRPFNFTLASYQKSVEAYRQLVQTIDRAHEAGFNKEVWQELSRDFIAWAGTIGDEFRELAKRLMRSSGPES